MSNKNIQRAKRITIIGTVTARVYGQRMAGVKVALKGTQNETLTDAAGKFALELPNKDSSQFIVFSFGGFKTVEYLHNVTRPGQEIAVDMMRCVDNVTDVLVGVVGGAVVYRRWYEPREIVKDVWWWLTGR